MKMLGVSSVCVIIILYADDILLIAPTITGLQRLLTVCEIELVQLDMQINVNKSMCIRFGPRFDHKCAELTTLLGGSIKWVSSCKYLGIFLISGRCFKCSFDQAKSKFFRAFNCIYSKVSCATNEDTVITLLKVKCLPILLYATEACMIQSRDRQSLEFAVTRAFMKIFHTGSSVLVRECHDTLTFCLLSINLSSVELTFCRDLVPLKTLFVLYFHFMQHLNLELCLQPMEKVFNLPGN